MSEKKIKENKEAVAEKMKILLLDNRSIQAQTLLDAMNDWLWMDEETKKRQTILSKLLNEE